MANAYVISTGTRIHPFGDPAGAAWVGGRPLIDLQAEEFANAGIPLVRAASPAAIPAGEPCFVLPDYLYVSAACLMEFAALVVETRETARLCLPVSPVTEYTRPLGGVESLSLPNTGAVAGYALFYAGAGVPAGAADAEGLFSSLAAGAARVVVRPRYAVRRLRHPNVGPRPFWTEIPVTDTLAAHVTSWTHVLWLNQILTGARLRAALAARPSPAEAARRVAVAANIPGCIADSVVGASLDAHPTARVENSVVGSGARIGARALVKDCIVGDDVVVGDGTRFVNCVIGDRCNSLSDSFFAHCTFYPDATLSNIGMRHCVIGRFAFITTAVLCFADSLDGQVKVFHDGAMRDTGRHILGACMGHETTLGTRAIFMPGCALPNGCIVVMPPGEGVHKIPGGIDQPLVWDAGTLRPVGEVFPGYVPADTDMTKMGGGRP